MRSTRIKSVIAVSLTAMLIVLAVAQTLLQEQVRAQNAESVMAPAFEVDPFWPKPLPNHWILGRTIGVAVDSRDHMFTAIRTRCSARERKSV